MSWYLGLESFVREQVPLAPLTNYRVGGAAEYFAEPPGEEALGMLLRRAAEHRLSVRMLGHGTNLLVGDNGVKGLILRLPRQGFARLERSADGVIVGAGHSLPGLVKWSAGAGLDGLGCLAGVPGTVGAALRMNAGGKYGEIGARVTGVGGCTLHGVPFWRAPEACAFAYRDSGLKDCIVTRCEMQLEEAEPAATRAFICRVLEEKRASQPLADRSAGCVFKNPRRPGVPPAGKLIDDAGLKGWAFGGARVSDKHANFLVCRPGAKAADLLKLIRHIRARVLREFGVALELEIETWGIAPDELAPRLEAA